MHFASDCINVLLEAGTFQWPSISRIICEPWKAQGSSHSGFDDAANVSVEDNGARKSTTDPEAMKLSQAKRETKFTRDSPTGLVWSLGNPKLKRFLEVYGVISHEFTFTVAQNSAQCHSDDRVAFTSHDKPWHSPFSLQCISDGAVILASHSLSVSLFEIYNHTCAGASQTSFRRSEEHV